MENENLQIETNDNENKPMNTDATNTEKKEKITWKYWLEIYIGCVIISAIIGLLLLGECKNVLDYVKGVFRLSIVFFLLYLIGLFIELISPLLSPLLSRFFPLDNGIGINPSPKPKKEKRKSKHELLQEQYIEHLESIPKFEIELSNVEIKRTALKDLEPIKHTNITKSTSPDKYFRFIAIDIETTGLSALSEIIEVSAIKFVDFEPVEVFTTLCKSKKPVPQEATEINHITNDMLENQPYFWEIVPSLQQFIDGFPLVAHNIDFDLKFLRMYGLDIDISKTIFIDTLELARKKLKKIKKDPDGYLHYDKDYDVIDHKLITVRDYFRIYQPKSMEHRALSDAYSTALVFKELLELIKG